MPKFKINKQFNNLNNEKIKRRMQFMKHHISKLRVKKSYHEHNSHHRFVRQAKLHGSL